MKLDKQVIDAIDKENYSFNKSDDYNAKFNNPYKVDKNDFDLFISTRETFVEFGYDEDKIDDFLAVNYYKKKLFFKDVRTKLLIAENYKLLDYFFKTPEVFNRPTGDIYASINYYNSLPDEEKEKRALVSLLSIPDKRRIERYGVSIKEMIEKYPLPEEKVILMERIHNAKLRAKETQK